VNRFRRSRAAGDGSTPYQSKTHPAASATRDDSVLWSAVLMTAIRAAPKAPAASPAITADTAVSQDRAGTTNTDSCPCGGGVLECYFVFPLQAQSAAVEARLYSGTGIRALNSSLNFPSTLTLKATPGFASTPWNWLHVSNHAL